ncbi:ectoine/hydroxyectoine ABC transporter permease subunit EhuD [Ornithinimicrobium pratense]|uniref:Ectoine/hydroxyectoine ABC transporter permease subunit EhuD n=1 Tax=Ornithinimicrobium pratense TaxID=2593973 RepID=A0A5J6V7A3_9MICO|nr:ectoine/hydroxyectoine ABC transporter permease subunit EhuD [Ornithinimicrobium pratense]QFG69427.1 ectoine/hydroxyectoine ABC transporter permease subunit EhuD [Ornithinimicrobium pratense]
MWETELFLEAFPILLRAFLEITLVVTVLGSFIAAVLGLVWAIGQRELPAWIARPLGWVLDFIRMTPLPVHLLIVYHGFPAMSAMTVGVVVIGIHYSTYMAESYRSGIESIGKGQWEAATALSLPQRRTWRAVILPQAIRNTLPSLGNWAIAMFKDTPFLIFISVPEMVTEARQFGGRHFTYIEAFTVAGILFLVASYPTAILMRKLEKRLAY